MGRPLNLKRSTTNEELFRRAKRFIPGGVNSPVRAFKAVGGVPLFIKEGKGSKIYDVTGRGYTDYCMSWGAIILGHAQPEVIKEVKKVLEKGTSFGAPTELEIKFSEMICKAFPSIEMIRLVNSGTEACMSAIRLARGWTGRKRIVKFAGCYHGHADYLLVRAGSGGMTFGVSDSAGVIKDIARHTLVLPYNNLEAVEKTIKKVHKDIACIIVEPVPANMGVVLPEPGFLGGLREMCDYYGVLLIFDEVITGFRVSYGGVQKLYGVQPDLTCLGKIIGGGLPMGAFGGKKKIMKFLAPSGPVYQAGTLSGNPVSVSAGLETLNILRRNKNMYNSLEENTGLLCEGIKDNIKRLKVDALINQIGSMFTVFFTDRGVSDYLTALYSNRKRYAGFFHGMLKKGVYFPPSQFESCFVSSAHTVGDIKKTIEATYEAFRGIK